MAQMVKNPPAVQETWVRSLSWDDPLEEGMAVHSSILAWRIPMDRGAWRATVHEVPKSWTRLKRLRTHALAHLYGVDADGKYNYYFFLKIFTVLYS